MTNTARGWATRIAAGALMGLALSGAAGGAVAGVVASEAPPSARPAGQPANVGDEIVDDEFAPVQKGSPRAPQLEPNLGWINTDRPLRFGQELKGRVVVLDFWSSACINCLHVVPDIEFLKKKYAKDPVVFVGVHSGKYPGESAVESVRAAARRHGISHPVVVDDQMGIWSRYTVKAWPSFVVVDPEGYAVGLTSGEGNRDVLDSTIRTLLEQHRAKGTLAKSPLEITREGSPATATGLLHPAKAIGVPAEGVGAGARGGDGYLFISDTAHHRVVIATLPDERGVSRHLLTVGDGTRGASDGPAPSARFREPTGLAFDARRGVLYVADRDNHLVRSVSLREADFGTVSTLVGTGRQSYDRRGGARGREQGLNSPWDLALSPDGGRLYIAMAGLHQVWETDLETLVTRRVAGTGREGIDKDPTPGPEAVFAQPSGLAMSGDGFTMYVADAEASGVRAVDVRSLGVTTLVGSGLFTFGDVDGPAGEARLQHPRGVAVVPMALVGAPAGEDQGGREAVLIADTLNNRLRVLDVNGREVGTWLESSVAIDGVTLNQPGGISSSGSRVFVADTNNHRVLVARAVQATPPGGGPTMTGWEWHAVRVEGLAK